MSNVMSLRTRFRRWLAAIGLLAVSADPAALAAPSNAPTQAPSHAPYSQPAANAIYNLLFCDDLAAFAAQPGQKPSRWVAALAAQPPNLAELSRLAADVEQDGRVRFMAYGRLRAASAPGPKRVLLGLITEVGLAGGVDTLAAFSDGGVRYINQSGRMVFAEGRTIHTAHQVDQLLAQAQGALLRLQPATTARAAPPVDGQVRYTFLTSDGPCVIQAPMDTLQRDPQGAPVLQAATELLLTMIRLGSK